MINLSKQTSIDDASMYLSFDSTISESTYYKTVAGDDSEVFDLLENSDSNGNTTLEPITEDDIEPTESSIKEKLVTLHIPFKNVLNEYGVVSSTPSKNDTTEISDRTSSCVTANETVQKTDLITVFANESIQNKKNLSVVFNNLVAQYEQQNNKENELPNISEDSQQNNKENDLPNISEDSLPSFSKTSLLKLKQQNENFASGTEKGTDVQKSLLNVQKENKNRQTLQNVKKVTQFKATVEKKEEAKVKTQPSTRKSVCEPNLLANRPSRIVPSKKKRLTIASNTLLTQPPSNRTVQTKARIALSQLALKTSVEGNEKLKIIQDSKNNEEDKLNIKTSGAIRKSLAVPKVSSTTRKSILQNLQHDKRHTSQRLPIAVKTTYNSATRKSNHKMTMANGAVVSKRRSVLLLQSKITSPLTRSKNPSITASQITTKTGHAHVRTVGGEDKVQAIPTKQRSENIRATMYVDRPKDFKFICTECGQSYHVKSLLNAHKRIHQSESPEISKRSPYTMATALGTSAYNPNSSNHKCKYCDKGFVLERALHIHLMEHCLKIPATERRKLDFTEMDHVEKAETPHFHAAQKKPSVLKTLETNKEQIILHMPFRHAGGSAISTNDKKQTNKNSEFINPKRSDNTVKKSEKIRSPKKNDGTEQMPPPPPLTKIKRKTAHAGVYRTPNKDIPCRACNRSFKSILDYTNHMMSTHSMLNESDNSING